MPTLCLGRSASPYLPLVYVMVVCKYCGSKWRSMQSLRAHLRHCLERKKARNEWIRYPLRDGSRSAVLCVVSRSPKTIKALDAQHRLLTAGRMDPLVFLGIVEGLRLTGLIETQLEGS